MGMILMAREFWMQQTLEAFITISVLSQLMYLLLLHAGMFSRRYGPAYHPNNHSPPQHGGIGTSGPTSIVI